MYRELMVGFVERQKQKQEEDEFEYIPVNPVDEEIRSMVARGVFKCY